MKPDNPELMDKIIRARDKLADQLLSHPEVSLIDIGDDPENRAPFTSAVLRVHVRQRRSISALNIPDEIDGIPVRVVVGDYRAE